jgi:hypothetical protein
VAVDRRRLVRRWVHAHEEDSQEEMVFRPADWALPPSRGRRSLDLRADGSLVEEAPGPTDRPEEGGGSWELGDEDVLVVRSAAQEPWRARVVSVQPDRLVLDKRMLGQR